MTGISFLALGGYDIIAVWIVAAHRVSTDGAASPDAISNTLGFHSLTAATVRYRLLHGLGLNSSEVAGVTALSRTALALGLASMFSLALAASTKAGQWQRIGGIFLLGMLLLSARWLGAGKIMCLWQYSLRLPPEGWRWSRWHWGPSKWLLPSGRLKYGFGLS